MFGKIKSSLLSIFLLDEVNKQPLSFATAARGIIYVDADWQQGKLAALPRELFGSVHLAGAAREKLVLRQTTILDVHAPSKPTYLRGTARKKLFVGEDPNGYHALSRKMRGRKHLFG